MTPDEFIAKWRHVDLKERSAAHEHFIDLCHLLGHPTPAEADPTGERFCFEKGLIKQGRGVGFADVWKQGFFGWEYKGKHKDLNAAYNQLLLYRDALENPPLLVLCDLDRIVIHTNFTNTVSVRHEIALEQLDEPRSVELLRALFFDPELLRPGLTSEAVTQDAAEQVAGIADSMRGRGLDPAAVAHFLDRVVFCLFAEDVDLLPDKLFTRIVEKATRDPSRFVSFVSELFAAMSTGGFFGLDSIRHFNGSLFDDAPVPALTPAEVERIRRTTALDWSAVDPSIFGTLFERGLDPAKRAQLGAHFTGKPDILALVDAVVMTPLRREWDATRQTVTSLLTTGKKSVSPPSDLRPPTSDLRPLTPAQSKKAVLEASSLLHGFLVRLQNVKVLDPACGSGNFLYVTLQALKDLEKAVIVFAMDNGLGSFLPLVGPWQLYGIEVNPYAFDLAQMTVWIGWLQWIRANGFGFPADPVLRALPGNFQCRDAILGVREPGSGSRDSEKDSCPAPDFRSPIPEFYEPEWPRVDFIVGNPPFLGGKMLRRELGDAYLDALFALWDGRVPHEADLCCYWFEKTRAHLAAGGCSRAGLLATQGIRGGANRDVLTRIQETCNIFWAVSDKDWVLDGANVHISMVAFDNGEDESRTLDGSPTKTIRPNLTSAGADLTQARPQRENADIAFMGVTPAGPFDVTAAQALRWLAAPNPHGRPNSDLLRPYLNGADLNQRSRGQWTIDAFGRTLAQVMPYAEPYGHLEKHVQPVRASNNRPVYRDLWWCYAEGRPAMRAAFAGKARYLATCMVAKHRLFVWLDSVCVPANVVIVFARDDDFFFGVLHSRLHEVWSLAQGTQLEDRPRYTPTTCFETFPFPHPTEAQTQAIAAAARELNALRERWLNPPEWLQPEVLEFPAAFDGPWSRFIARPNAAPAAVCEAEAGWTPRDLYDAEKAVRLAAEAAQLHTPQPEGIGTARYPRQLPRDAACAKQLTARTLTKLYNARPAWLALAHRTLDEAVFAAYGWPADLTDGQLLERLLALNLERA
jgi:hypothetical protein